MKYTFLISIISLLSFKGYSQKTTISLDSYNEKYVFINVLKTYERVANKGYKSIDLFKKLGDGHYVNSEFEKAVIWYSELFKLTLDLEPEYYIQYAKSLKIIGNIEKSNEILEKLNKKI